MSIHSENSTAKKYPGKRPRATPRQPFDPERRADILRAALVIFARKGFHRSTIRDIAREANLADGTIYNHFQNKNALLISLLQGLNQAGQREVALSAADDQDLQTFLPQHFRHLLQTLTQGTGDALAVILAELLTNPELRQAYPNPLVANAALGEQALSRWAKQGKVRGEHLELMVGAVSAMLLGLVVMRLLGDSTLEAQWDQLPEFISDFVLNGIKL